MPKSKTGILGKMNPQGNRKEGQGSPFVTKTAYVLVGFLVVYFAVTTVSNITVPKSPQQSQQQVITTTTNNVANANPDSLTPLALGSVRNPTPIRKVFENGDFESPSISPWHYLDNTQWGGFKVVQEPSSNGGAPNQFVRVDALTSAPVPSLKVFGAVQEWNTEEQIPNYLNFQMRVHGEKKLCSKQYAQAVVIFLKEGAEDPKHKNLQLRIVLHGVEKQPYYMSNAKFHVNPPYKMSAQGWRNYSLPILDWFKKGFPTTPDGHWEGGRIRLLVEARYDNLPTTTPDGVSVISADYDNISFSATPQ